jgi:outer membrane murein-binding lipoprotein Lpp
MRLPSAWLVASSVVLLAGCGSSSPPPKTAPAPKIPAALARQLAGDADTVAASVGCAGHGAATRLLADLTANISQIPARYQEPLTTAANDLAAGVPACAAPHPQPPAEKPKGHGEHKHKKHGHHGGEEGDG